MIAAIDLARILGRFHIKSGWIFYSAAFVFVGYLLYTMIRKRRGERPGEKVRETEL